MSYLQLLPTLSRILFFSFKPLQSSLHPYVYYYFYFSSCQSPNSIWNNILFPSSLQHSSLGLRNTHSLGLFLAILAIPTPQSPLPAPASDIFKCRSQQVFLLDFFHIFFFPCLKSVPKIKPHYLSPGLPASNILPSSLLICLHAMIKAISQKKFYATLQHNSPGLQWVDPNSSALPPLPLPS